MAAIKILQSDPNRYEVESGAYVLRMRVAAPLSLSFGRFQGGQAIALPAGEMLYVGSAMGRQGSSTLARRLLRHATRTDARPPHTIREPLLTQLRVAGLGGSCLGPPTMKTCRWHVDYLLDQRDVDLTHILAIRTEKRLEPVIAGQLAADDHTAITAPGLGASDSPGATHLLRLEAAAGWWAGLIDTVGRHFSTGN